MDPTAQSYCIFSLIKEITMSIHRKIGYQINDGETPSASSLTIIDILNVLEARHELLREQWQDIVEAIDEDTHDQLIDRAVVMDTELSRHKRFFRMLRERIEQKEVPLHFNCCVSQ
jgi:hypothetical protein